MRRTLSGIRAPARGKLKIGMTKIRRIPTEPPKPDDRWRRLGVSGIPAETRTVVEVAHSGHVTYIKGRVTWRAEKLKVTREHWNEWVRFADKVNQ